MKTWEKVMESVNFIPTEIKVIPDFDGDGVQDILTSNTNALFAYSTVSGAELFTQSANTPGVEPNTNFGHSLGSTNDTNGDLITEYVAGAPLLDVLGLNDRGAVYIYDGSTHTQLFRWLGPEADAQFGFDLAANQDISGDGKDNLLVGAPFTDANGLVDSGAVYVYHISNRNLIYTIAGPQAGGLFGTSVDYIPDVNNDGLADLIIGAPSRNQTGAPISGSSYIHSGSDGALLFTLSAGQILDQFGASVSSAGDLNQDGYGDVVIGAPGTHGFYIDAGAAYTYSGFDGSLLMAVSSDQADAKMGQSVAGDFDFNGDGYDDVVVGTPFHDAPGGHNFKNFGSVIVYSGFDQSRLAVEYGMVPEDRQTSSKFGSIVAASRDMNNDGKGELLMNGPILYYGPWETGDLEPSIFVMQPTPFLTSDAPSISNGIGGVVKFSLDFGQSPARTPRNYQLLGSTAVGLFQGNGVNIPLAAGNQVFDSMLSGSASAFFLDPIAGTLDGDGKATVRLDLPPGGAAGFVGTTLYFSAGETATNWPKHSSLPVALEIQS